MKIQWKNINIERPLPLQDCLTKTSRGLISGTFDCYRNCFFNIFKQNLDGYWKDIEWDAEYWYPMNEITEELM